MNTPPFNQTDLKMIELCSEYLSLQCIWLYVLIMSRTRCRVNQHSILNVKELFGWSRRNAFDQRVPWHSGNYRVWIHSETHTWLDKNIHHYFLGVFLFFFYVYLNVNWIRKWNFLKKSKIKQCKLKLYYKTVNIKLTFKANLIGKC